MAERSTRQKALGACVVLALSLHALAFWAVNALSSGQRPSGTEQAVQIVQLRLSQGELALTERQAAVTDSALAPAPPKASETGSHLDPRVEVDSMSPAGEGEPRTEARADTPSLYESGLMIEHPDSPLPGGLARAQVTMIFGRRGQIDAIELEPGALPDAFIEAVRSTFVGRMASSGLGLQPNQQARLCVEVEFREGEPPRWRIQGPPSGPDLHC